MKRLIYIFEALALMLGLNACTAEIVAPMQVSGDCLIEEIALDNYAGTVDLLTRTVEVRLPMGYDAATMKVSKLTLSSGADCNVRQGETLNMNTARVLKVTNGDVCLDWTLSILRDEALITQFVVNDIYAGAIDQDARTITITVPASVGVTHLVPTITYSKYATVTPAPGVAQDFTNPVTYTVKNNTAETAYVVTVTAIGKPKALFVGSAATMEELDPEARTACEWMMANVPSTLYASFADLRIGTIDMSDCKLIWWHWHMDWGVDGHNGFEEKGQDALSTRNQLREFYENGGALLLTRYATHLPSFIGVTGDDEWTTPNNCWGGAEDSAELCGGPWDFNIYAGQKAHPLFQDLVQGDDANKVYCTDAGYHITNSTAQYHIGSDWGGYNDHADWEARTGGKILGVGGDGAVVAWEYEPKDGMGGIVCIGSGCYDWYSYTYEDGYAEKFHKNIEIITKNAINHLTK